MRTLVKTKIKVRVIAEELVRVELYNKLLQLLNRSNLALLITLLTII